MSIPVPKVLSRKTKKISPWLSLIEKEIQLPGRSRPEIYHFVGQMDYVAAIAETPSKRIPIIQQFRPAVEVYTWELPSGLIDSDETPGEVCRRELREEVGVEAKSLSSLGVFYADTGRMENKQYVFFAEVSEPVRDFTPEPNTTVEYVTYDRLLEMIASGQFSFPAHIGIVFLYNLFMKIKRENKPTAGS